jgi:predicted DNA-binding transcriptional regulator YafY
VPRYEGRDAMVRRLAMVLLYTNRCKQMPHVRTLARGLSVSERTIVRDLNALEDAGWPMPPRQNAEQRV